MPIALPFVALMAVLPQGSLADIQADYAKLSALEPVARLAKQNEINQSVFKLAETDRLKSGEEFRIASQLVDEGDDKLVACEARYELCYTAAVLGDEAARRELATHWDSLMMALGRHRPMGVVKLPAEMPTVGHWIVEPAPDVVTRIWLAPRSTPGTADNAEVAQLFKDDQAIRNEKLSTKDDVLRMMHEDVKRLKRIKELVTAGALSTANDFYWAAFLFQHGSAFEEYQLAHELAVCSVLLGKSEGRWIGAATYDRMLQSCGHPQRWATQYRLINGASIPSPTSTTGIGEGQRKIVVGVTMAEAAKRSLRS